MAVYYVCIKSKQHTFYDVLSTQVVFPELKYFKRTDKSISCMFLFLLITFPPVLCY